MAAYFLVQMCVKSPNALYLQFNLKNTWLQVQILPTDLRTFCYSISGENFLKDQSNFPLVIILSIFYNLFSWLCIDTVRRILTVVTLGTS